MRTDLTAARQLSFLPPTGPSDAALKAGFRCGDLGTHSSRTIMLAELEAALAAVPPEARRADYAAAIIEANCLSKPTFSTRRLTNQRLGELYGLDPAVPLFRVLRRLWAIDEAGRPLLALLACLARDPLLRATAPVIVGLPEGAELQRRKMRAVLRAAVDNRLNEATLDKVVRNTASSWTQSGHLEGRTFKIRRLVRPTPASVAFTLYLGHAAGFRGEELLASGWVAVLDCSASSARDLAVAAKRLGLIDLRMAGEVIELGLERLDPAAGRF
jgi:hypothetical protein